MPTYDYQCRACGTVTEVIHPMAEDGPTVCEVCGGQLRRVLHPAGIIFKGSGFYRTDSRKADGSPAATSSSTPSSGTDSKPAADSSKGEPKAKAPATESSS